MLLRRISTLYAAFGIGRTRAYRALSASEREAQYLSDRCWGAAVMMFAGLLEFNIPTEPFYANCFPV